MVDHRHPAQLTRQARANAPKYARARAAKAIWSNPERRAKELEKRRGAQAKYLGEAILHRGGVQMSSRRTENLEYTSGEDDQPFIRRLRRLSPRVRRLVYVLLDPVYAKAPIRDLAAAADCPAKVVRRAMLHSAAFWPLVDGLRKVAFKYQRHRLAGKIVGDALTTLEEVHPAKAGALIAMQEQAAAIVGLTVEAPRVELTADVSVDGELAAIRQRLKISTGKESPA